jgi:predicted O-methyltransferase YrrM
VNPELEAFLDTLLAEGRAHDAGLADRRERLRNVESETARMLAVLVRATGARRVLELGTSNGYSTVWLADGAAGAGGSVTTVELDRGRAAMARETFVRAEMSDRIKLVEGDAGRLLASTPDGTWDFVFLDAERSLYAGWWPDLSRALARPGLLAVDNVLSHAGEVAELGALVDADAGFESALVPIGAGVLLVSPAG